MKYLLFIFLLIPISEFFPQDQLTVDELFIKARETAFQKNDRNKAREICYEILKRSPDYTDVSVFLARLYTWDDMDDSARTVFKRIFSKDSTNEDAINAAIDLEYWSDKPESALKYCNLGLRHYPRSEDFLLKKAKALADLKMYDAAFITLETLLIINNSNADALNLAERLKEEVRKNSITIRYSYEKFNRIYSPWHLGYIAYSRYTPIGTALFRLNYGDRFDTKGVQYEVDMYPRFADGLYAYLNAGYSNSVIFPKTRYGASLYYSLPYSFEVEAGFRFLRYSSDVWIYTIAAGKYYSNFWFSLRTYITPKVKSASHSYSLTVRYYLSGADDYLEFYAGTGITPDVSSIDNQYNWLKSNKAGIEYDSKLIPMAIIFVFVDYTNEERPFGDFISGYTMGLGLKYLF